LVKISETGIQTRHQTLSLPVLPGWIAGLVKKMMFHIHQSKKDLPGF
jgi:hypothetical protein